MSAASDLRMELERQLREAEETLRLAELCRAQEIRCEQVRAQVPDEPGKSQTSELAAVAEVLALVMRRHVQRQHRKAKAARRFRVVGSKR